VAAAVKERMAELNVDQAEVVRRSGLSDPFVRGIMRGNPRGTPRPKNLRQFAEALAWSPDSIDRLLAGDDPVELDTPTPAGDDVSDLVGALRQAVSKSDGRDDKLDQIIALCQGMASNQLAVAHRLDENERRLEALLNHFGLVVAPEPSPRP